MPPVVLTVAASLRLSVNVTVLPASRSPLDGDSAIELIVGVVITLTPVKVSGRLEVLSALPARSVIVPVTAGYLQRGGVLTERYRVAEHQRTGAGAADITGGAAIVERQRRRAGHVHRLAHVERQRQHLAGTVVARGRRHRRYRRRCGVDLRPGLGQAGERQAGGIAGAVLDGPAVEVDRRRRQRRSVLTGANRVAEGQRIGARAAAIGRGAAIVERQRRRAAVVLTVTTSLVSSVSVTVLPASRSPLEGLSTSDEIVGVVVSICGPV